MITETIEWVPVEERLPGDQDDKIVAHEDDGVVLSVAFRGTCKWFSPFGDEIRRVTNWAEIKGPECKQKED